MIPADVGTTHRSCQHPHELNVSISRAAGLTRATYIGTEAASALTMHLTKIATYGMNDLLTNQVLLYGVALTPATLLGAWLGKKIVSHITDRSSSCSSRSASPARAQSSSLVCREDALPPD